MIWKNCSSALIVIKVITNFQGLAFWCPVALVEFAILDLLGRLSNQSLGQMLGNIVRTTVPFYVASGRRDTTPEQEIVYLQSLIDQTGAKAIKYRVGGRMSRNADAMPGRTDKLIPLSRKSFGDKMVIHADANSSYDPPEAIRVGRLLQDIKAIHYEEPCPFDNFDATKKVTDALDITIAFGEQESSLWRFQWCIREHVVDIVQPPTSITTAGWRSVPAASPTWPRPATWPPPSISPAASVLYTHFTSPRARQRLVRGRNTKKVWRRMVNGSTHHCVLWTAPSASPTGPGVGLGDPTEILKGATVIGSPAIAKKETESN